MAADELVEDRRITEVIRSFAAVFGIINEHDERTFGPFHFDGLHFEIQREAVAGRVGDLDQTLLREGDAVLIHAGVRGFVGVGIGELFEVEAEMINQAGLPGALEVCWWIGFAAGNLRFLARTTGERQCQQGEQGEHAEHRSRREETTAAVWEARCPPPFAGGGNASVS